MAHHPVSTDDPVVEQLRSALAEAVEIERRIEVELVEHRERLLSARNRTKQIRRALALFPDAKSPRRLTKKVLRPIVESLLQTAGRPLADEQLLDELKQALREKHLPCTGLALILRSFPDLKQDGVWRLPTSTQSGDADRSVAS